MTRRTPFGGFDSAAFLNAPATDSPSLPDLLRLIAQSVDADLIQVGIDVGTGYRRDCFIEHSAEMANFSDASPPPFVVTRETRVRRSASPSGLIATPNWLEQRALHVGSAGRRSAPRSGIALLRNPSRPAFKASERRQFALLLPHFNVALALACELERARCDARQARIALECAQLGTLVLSRDGVPLQGNTLAFECLDRARITLAPRLRFPDPAIQARFDAVLRRDPTCPPASEVRLRLESVPPLVIELHPLAPESERPTPTAPHCLMLVRTLAEAPALDPAAAHHFDLTPAEFRLCCALAGGMSLRACAQAWHRSYETLRSQLKTVLAKTGTHRQIELIALLDRFKNR